MSENLPLVRRKRGRPRSANPLEVIAHVRLTAELNAKLRRLGGSSWIRAEILAASDPIALETSAPTV